MSPPPPPPEDQSGSAAAGVKTAIRELAHGREAAVRLGALLRGSFLAAAGELAEEVLASVLRALLALEHAGESAALLRSPAAAADGGSSLCSAERGAATSAGKRKARTAGDRDGGRRGRSASGSWTVPAKTLDDGHGWRKYGQKAILSARFQRSYFRCKHKFDEGCQAIRQVQRSAEDPSTFLVTYIGHHTCASSSRSGHPGAGRPLLISFGAPREQPVVRPPGARSQHAPAADLTDDHPPPPPPPEQECVADEDAGSNLSHHGSSSEYFSFTLPELAALGSTPSLPPPAASDVAGDATSGPDSSCVSPSCSLYMDLGVDSIQVDDLFDLDGDDLVLSFVR